YRLPAHNSVSVWCTQAELPEAPWFVRWRRGNERAFRQKLPVKVIHALNIPVRKVGVISQFARRSLIHALTEHHPEAITRQKAPTLGVDRVLPESENVHVVTS